MQSLNLSTYFKKLAVWSSVLIIIGFYSEEVLHSAEHLSTPTHSTLGKGKKTQILIETYYLIIGWLVKL